MFVPSDAGRDGEPHVAHCKGCKRPFEQDDPIEEIRFDPDPVHRLEEMNGPYHARCARPLVSIVHALAMLDKRPG